MKPSIKLLALLVFEKNWNRRFLCFWIFFLLKTEMESFFESKMFLETGAGDESYPQSKKNTTPEP